MKRWGFGLLLVVLTSGCSDRLADIQHRMEGTWVLESRQLRDGTVLRPPQIAGAITWVPIDSRKAHVSLNVFQSAEDRSDNRFNYAGCTYEISTSAITQARYVLVRQGYRSSAEAPFTVYPKAKSAKGKITVGGQEVEIAHDDQRWVFQNNTLTASYEGSWVDTWKRVE